VEKATEHRAGAGIGVDDASVAILKRLGLKLGSRSNTINNEIDGTNDAAYVTAPDVMIQRMRPTEERLANRGQNPTFLLQQPYPYFAVLYSELEKCLEKVIVVSKHRYSTHDRCVLRGRKATKIERPSVSTRSAACVYFDEPPAGSYGMRSCGCSGWTKVAISQRTY
jgi:hypothetical protein